MGRVFAIARAIIGALVLAGFVLLAVVAFVSPRIAPPPTVTAHVAPAVARRPNPLVSMAPLACLGPLRFVPAAAHNEANLNSTPVTPFGVPERGWAVYAPLIAHEIGTSCGPSSPAFAEAYSRWQSAHAFIPTGEVDPPALSLLTMTWLLRRPFVLAMKAGCPASPLEGSLATAAPSEAYGGKTVQARAAALDAYRRMVASARQDLKLPPQVLTIASAYRGPMEETARCADGSCGNPAKAHCSAHRTGLAFDLYLGSAPGREPFSTAYDDRLQQSRTPAYRWLVQHAGEFGFTPYPYEPWHWEWTGEPV